MVTLEIAHVDFSQITRSTASGAAIIIVGYEEGHSQGLCPQP